MLSQNIIINNISALQITSYHITWLHLYSIYLGFIKHLCEKEALSRIKIQEIKCLISLQAYKISLLLNILEFLYDDCNIKKHLWKLNHSNSFCYFHCLRTSRISVDVINAGLRKFNLFTTQEKENCCYSNTQKPMCTNTRVSKVYTDCYGEIQKPLCTNTTASKDTHRLSI